MSSEQMIQQMLERMRSAWISDGSGVEAERNAFNEIGAHFPKATGVAERWMDVGAIPALVTTPLDYDEESDPVVLYFHGGAFLIGSAEIYRYQSSRIAHRAGAGVVHVDYRLAPEHPFPAAIDDALSAYHGLVGSGVEPARIILAGDSAGGNLALVTAMRLRDADALPPAGLVLLSPWVDLTCSGESMDTNANDLHLAQRRGLLASASTYLDGQDPRNPLASPLFGDLTGLPPTLIQVGALETLLDESLSLEQSLSSAGTSVKLHVFDGMVHEWHLLSALLEPDATLDGADQAFDEIGQFVQERCGE
jgi:epsilon-lactone hydrolase